MDTELQKYYENYFELFSSDGWKQLIEEVIESVSQTEEGTLNQSSADVFHYNRGYVGALKYLINLEAVVQMTFDDLNEDDQDADL